jgi:hypothetical protein
MVIGMPHVCPIGGVIGHVLGHDRTMSGDETPTTPDPETPDAKLDPAGLKDALGRTGRMRKTAGLPFEEDEFEDADDDSTSESSDESSSSEDSSSGSEAE